MDLRPFSPSYGLNTVAASAAASAVAAIRSQDSQVRVCNSGAAIAYVRCFDSAGGIQPATIGDCPVLPGTCVIISKSIGMDGISHISATGTTLNIQSGSGGFV